MNGMRVEIINTGTELLLGQVANTHLGFLAQSLFGLGIRVERQVTVPDGRAIAEALSAAMTRADLILVTGGLGPTSDDITREAAAEAFGRKLVFHPEILEGIAAKFASRKLVMNDLQTPQAMVPEGGVVLENKFGTAPGLIVENEKTLAVLLPGPPGELRPMWEHEALPWLMKRLAGRLTPVHAATLRILGLGETRVQMLVEDDARALGPVEVGYCARPGEVDLRLIATDKALVERAADLARTRLGDVVYAEDNASMEETVVLLGRARGKTVATAESCTGGLVANRITNVSHSSDRAGRPARSARKAWRGQRGGGAGDGPGRPARQRGRFCGGRDGNCRTDRRNAGEAGGPGLFRARRCGRKMRDAAASARADPRGVQIYGLANRARFVAACAGEIKEEPSRKEACRRRGWSVAKQKGKAFFSK
jgi:nicotinamide-nucleotide amidase